MKNIRIIQRIDKKYVGENSMKNISNIIEIQKENMEIYKELEYIEQYLEEYLHYDNWQDLKKALLSNA